MAALVVILPTAIATVVPPEGATRLHAADAVAWLVFQVLIAGAGAALYSRWRMSGESSTAWMAAGLVAAGLSGTPFAILDMADVAKHSGSTGDVTGAALAVPLVAMLWCAARNSRFPDFLHPLALGVVTGLVLISGRMLYSWLLANPVAVLAQPWGAIICTVLAAGFLIACVGLRRQRATEGLTPAQFAAVLAALMTSFLLGPAGTTGDTFRSWPAVVIMVLVSGWLTLSVSEALLEPLSLQARRIGLDTPPENQPTPASQHQEELFHELRSTVADISTASQLLLGNDSRMSDASRERLTTGLAAEMARLQRLVSGSTELKAESTSLDQVIAPLVVTQRAAGHDIHWEPSGHHVRSSPDDMTEIVHVLLHNALRHAPDTTITVSVRQRADDVEIRVSDAGPGIPAEVRNSLFERGIRSKESPGSGLGLYLARNLAAKHGGNLQLRHNDGRRGASFVVTLPHSEGEEN